jgi:hypothetical protein
MQMKSKWFLGLLPAITLASGIVLTGVCGPGETQYSSYTTYPSSYSNSYYSTSPAYAQPAYAGYSQMPSAQGCPITSSGTWMWNGYNWQWCAPANAAMYPVGEGALVGYYGMGSVPPPSTIAVSPYMPAFGYYSAYGPTYGYTPSYYGSPYATSSLTGSPIVDALLGTVALSLFNQGAYQTSYYPAYGAYPSMAYNYGYAPSYYGYAPSYYGYNAGYAGYNPYPAGYYRVNNANRIAIARQVAIQRMRVAQLRARIARQEQRGVNKAIVARERERIARERNRILSERHPRAAVAAARNRVDANKDRIANQKQWISTNRDRIATERSKIASDRRQIQRLDNHPVKNRAAIRQDRASIQYFHNRIDYQRHTISAARQRMAMDRGNVRQIRNRYDLGGNRRNRPPR